MSLAERQSSPRTPARIRVLDGVRGLAIGLVLLCHGTLYFRPESALQFALQKVTGIGWIGVDLFFVLSGFLITGVLLKLPRERFFRTFYMRRTLRIFPIYYLFLALFFLGLPALINVHRDPWVSDLIHQQAVFWLYIQNWMFSYVGQFPGSSYLDHFWSLAIEEQFYVVWPALVFVLNRRLLLRLCPLLIALALLLRVQFLMDGSSWVAVYVNTLTRMDTLICGALLRLLYESRLSLLQAARHWLVALAAFLLLVVATLAVAQLDFSRGVGTQTVGYLAIALLFALLIHFTLQSHGGLLQRLFERRWLVALGKYSYGIYILHWPILYFLYGHSGFYLWAADAFGNLIGLVLTFTVGVGGTLGLAALSWHFFEAPILRLRERLEGGSCVDRALAEAVVSSNQRLP